MSSPLIPRFVRFSASFATNVLTHVISTPDPSPCTFIPVSDPEEVSPCATRELSPSPHLQWYVTFCAPGCQISWVTLHKSLPILFA